MPGTPGWVEFHSPCWFLYHQQQHMLEEATCYPDALPGRLCSQAAPAHGKLPPGEVAVMPLMSMSHLMQL